MPSTKLGWWSVGLMAAFVVLFIMDATVFMPSTVVMPWRQAVLRFYGIAMMTCEAAAGIVGLIAVVRRHERSWLVWLTMLAGLWLIVFMLGEFLVPHWRPGCPPNKLACRGPAPDPDIPGLSQSRTPHEILQIHVR